MPYTGPDDTKLPPRIQRMSRARRGQWVAAWNSTYTDCQESGGEDCEGAAFAVANAAMESKSMPDTTIKSLSDGRIGGYLVVWGDADHPDLQGEYFTPETELGLDWYPRRPVLYHHGLDGTMKAALVGAIDTLKPDAVGLWAEGQLDLRNEYVQAVRQLVERGALAWSSGSVPHLVEVEPDGRIKRWPIVEGSMTPTPAEPRRTGIAPIKHVCDAVELQAAYKSAGLDFPASLLADGGSVARNAEAAGAREQAAVDGRTAPILRIVDPKRATIRIVR